jgi:Fe-Mn family superoxide dismutase
MEPYRLPDLPYDYSALEPHYSARHLELHHDKHHAAYVKGANDTLDKLADGRAKSDFAHIIQLEKSLAFNVSGHILHSILWENLSPDGGGAPSGELARQVDVDFGSADALRNQMTEAANTVQGAGWAVMAWEHHAGRLLVEQVYDHQGNIGQGATPLLVLDMWEHAYYLQYENQKADWVKAYWRLVNWANVAERFAAAARHATV